MHHTQQTENWGRGISVLKPDHLTAHLHEQGLTGLYWAVNGAFPALTSVRVVEIHEPLPLVMVQQTENGSPQTGPHLDDELHVGVNGEAGCDEGGVQGATERGQRVHGLPVVEAEDGVNPSGELGADWWQRQSKGSEQGEVK